MNEVTVKRLSTGYYHVRGVGPCNWAQPQTWPCSEAHLREHAFPQASERFLERALAALRKESDDA